MNKKVELSPPVFFRPVDLVKQKPWQGRLPATNDLSPFSTPLPALLLFIDHATVEDPDVMPRAKCFGSHIQEVTNKLSIPGLREIFELSVHVAN